VSSPRVYSVIVIEDLRADTLHVYGFKEHNKTGNLFEN
jgi:hypothetical protein